MIGAQDLRTLVGLDTADDSQDARLWALEAGAVAWVQRQTGRYFGPPETMIEELRGLGTARLYLEDAPLVDPATVDEYAYVGAAAAQIAADADDGFEVWTASGATDTNDAMLVRKGCHVWCRGRLYVVEYQRGYEVTAAGVGGAPDDIAAPDDIREFVKGYVRFVFDQQDPEIATGMRSETMGGYSYTRGGELGDPALFIGWIPGAAETLAKWTRVRV